MDPSSLQEMARSQGPVFWVAAVAIALGVTLLVMALTQLLSRRLNARLTGDEPAPRSAPATAPAADIYVPTQPLVTSEFTTPVRAVQPVDGDHSLALLLRRLQSAGDRLEEVAGDLWHDESNRDESGLKEAQLDVEYVFRASGP